VNSVVNHSAGGFKFRKDFINDGSGFLHVFFGCAAAAVTWSARVFASSLHPRRRRRWPSSRRFSPASSRLFEHGVSPTPRRCARCDGPHLNCRRVGFHSHHIHAREPFSGSSGPPCRAPHKTVATRRSGPIGVGDRHERPGQSALSALEPLAFTQRDHAGGAGPTALSATGACVVALLSSAPILLSVTITTPAASRARRANILEEPQAPRKAPARGASFL